MLEACRPRRCQVLAWGPRRLAAAATGRSPLVQTALPNGVAPSCWSTVPSAVSDVSGAGAFVRAVCRACAHPTQFVVQSIFVVHPRSECRSRNSPLRSQAVYRELQRPYPAVPRDAVIRRFGRVVEAVQLRMDSKRGPSCGYVRLPAQPFEAAQDDARGQSKAGRGHGQTGGRSCCCGGRRDARILFRRVESHGPGRGDDGGRIL